MEFFKDFGSRMRMIRESKGISREELAQRCVTSTWCIGRYERGEDFPSRCLQSLIFDELGIRERDFWSAFHWVYVDPDQEERGDRAA